MVASERAESFLQFEDSDSAAQSYEGEGRKLFPIPDMWANMLL